MCAVPEAIQAAGEFGGGEGPERDPERQGAAMSGAQFRIRNRAGQRGQAAVLSALCLFSMVVFLALATNAGILVNDRIRIQNTADLSAYAGAFEQARTMNQVADINSRIYRHVQRVRGVLNYGPAYISNDPPDSADVFYWRQPPCSCLDYSPAAQAYIKAAQAAINVQAGHARLANKRGQISSRAAATFTASKNFLGPNISRRHLYFFQNDGNSPTGQPEGVVNLDRVQDTMVGYNYLRSCRCCLKCCDYPQIHTEPITTWVYKADDTKVYFPAKVKGVPDKNFVDIGPRGNGYFGAGATGDPSDNDMLYGYAAAKPYEGIIGTKKPDNDNIGGSTIPQNPVYPPSTQLEDYFHATYRARMAGINENMGTANARKSMADLIRADSTEPKFQSKVDYFTH
jgi:hypothetical protein